MNPYEKLLSEVYEYKIIVKEKDLQGHDGLIFGNRIAIRTNLTTIQKSCVLAEEFGHYHMNTGDILNQKNLNNSKQEHLGRMYAYNRLIGLTDIIKAYEAGCQNQYETAEFLNVTEEFLTDAISAYRSKYGTFTTFNNYAIYFIPNLGVMKLL